VKLLGLILVFHQLRRERVSINALPPSEAWFCLSKDYSEELMLTLGALRDRDSNPGSHGCGLRVGPLRDPAFLLAGSSPGKTETRASNKASG